MLLFTVLSLPFKVVIPNKPQLLILSLLVCSLTIISI